jgi:hypothetical protein
MMTQYFPVIVEQESNGTFSAWVAGRDSFRFVGVGALLGRGTRRRHRGVTAATAADPQRLQADPSTPGNRPTSTTVADACASRNAREARHNEPPGRNRNPIPA